MANNKKSASTTKAMGTMNSTPGSKGATSKCMDMWPFTCTRCGRQANYYMPEATTELRDSCDCEGSFDHIIYGQGTIWRRTDGLD